jgi:hypothetical protein
MKTRSSNFMLRGFVAISLLFCFFVLGAIINQFYQQFQQSDIEPEEPEQELLNKQ